VPLTVCDHSQGVLLPFQDRRRSIVFGVLFQQTNKQTNNFVAPTNAVSPLHFTRGRSVPIQISNWKQKQHSLSGMYCRISCIPNHYNQNTYRNRFIPVTFEFVTICEICYQNVTKSVWLKNFKKNRACHRGHTSKIVTSWHRQNCHTLSVTGTKPVSVSAWNPDPNGSKQNKTKQDSRVLTTCLLGRTLKLSLCVSQLLLINFIFKHFSEPSGNQRLLYAERQHTHFGNPQLSFFTTQTSRPSQVPTTLTSGP